LNALRGKLLSLLIGSVGLAVAAGAVFSSRDLIRTAWYARGLRSGNAGDQKAAVVSLAGLRTNRAARVLVDILGEAKNPAQFEAMRALKDMGAVAMEPLAEAFQVTDDVAGTPERSHSGGRELLKGSSPRVDAMLAVLLELQREEPGVKSLLKNIGSRLDDDPVSRLSRKHLAWKSGVQTVEGSPCRIFHFDPELQSWPGSQPQTIVLTDAAGKVITWKEVGGEPMFVSCEIETRNGEVLLIVTCDERRRDSPGKYTYRLTLRGIEG
jgi:hypothetical protein